MTLDEIESKIVEACEAWIASGGRIVLGGGSGPRACPLQAVARLAGAGDEASGAEAVLGVSSLWRGSFVDGFDGEARNTPCYTDAYALGRRFRARYITRSAS